MKKRQSCSSSGNQKRNDYTFSIDDQRSIFISSNFQSGNIVLVKQINELYYILEALPDIQNAHSKKSWFYFKTRSQRNIKVRLIIQNVNIYDYIFQDRIYCKPMMKEGQNGSWIEASEAFLTYRDQLSIVIDHTFKNQEDVYFCLSVPFTYNQNELYLQKIKQSVHQNISYQDQILAETPNGNSVHLLTITQKSQNHDLKVSILPEDRKPVVFVTARVHPGQVSSTFCLQGILQMLLDYNNLQSYLLRRLFVFKIVPMLNPDGVIQGNYRMDPQGFNLNRFYLQPSQQQHPSIFNVLQLMRILGAKQKIEFYFDLHSHSSIKQAFIYGNALEDIVSQTYSQSFCKILEQNFPRFRYGLSNFDEQHMKHKDRGQALSKQGCSRVVINRLCGVVCSYTVESSVFPSSYGNFIKKCPKSIPNNTAFIYNNKQSSFWFSNVQAQSCQNIIVSQNKLLGKSLMVSLLDMVNKNPFSRLKDNAKQSIIKQIGLKLLQNEERFKLMDIKANQKVKMIHQFIKNKFEDPLNKEWNLTRIYQEINKSSWPPQFKPIIVFQELLNQKQNKASKLLKTRIKTEGKEKISITASLNKVKKVQNIPVFKKVEIEFAQSHRSISPNHPLIFPQIKYSVQMKLHSKGSIDTKTGLVKEMNLNIEDHQLKKVKKRVIIDYINEEINKITPDKQLLNKKDSSLNRLITNKIIEKERGKQKQSQMKQYKNIMVESRKRIATECREQTSKDALNQTKVKSIMQVEDENFKGLELRKAEIIKKRFMLTNKAIQILKRADKSKVKLPEVSKINLVIENSKKDKQTLDSKKSYQKIITNSIQT